VVCVCCVCACVYVCVCASVGVCVCGCVYGVGGRTNVQSLKVSESLECSRQNPCDGIVLELPARKHKDDNLEEINNSLKCSIHYIFSSM